MVCKMDINEISDTLKSIIGNTAKKLSGAAKRETFYYFLITTTSFNSINRRCTQINADARI